MLDIKLKLKPGHTSERRWMDTSPLRQLCWNATYACNYRCELCFTASGRPHSDELTTAEARQMIRRAHAAGILDIILSGGEPFMREDMVELLACMAESGMTARIASNGSLLTDDLLDRLLRETMTRSFQISLDTLDPHLYRRLHGAPAGSFRAALSAVRRVQERGFHTTVSVRVTPDTLPGIPRLLEMACVEGWATVTLHLPVYTGRVRNVFPRQTDVLTLLKPLLDHFSSLPENWVAETYIPWAQYHPVLRGFQGRIRFVHRGCRAGRDRLTVNATGWVSPCVCMDVPAAHLGNVRRDDICDLFENSPLCRMMRRPWEYGICSDCANVETCGGGCRASALALTGRFDGPDGCCPVRRRRILESNVPA